MAGQRPLGMGTTGASRRPASAVADGRGHDRQILVVGDGLAAAATAGFLDQAGLDPVLAATADERSHRAVLPIWEPGLALLERLGLRRPVERLGTPLDRLSCRTGGQSWTGEESGRPSLVAIEQGRLERLLERQLLDRLRRVERAVTDVESTGTGVRATFEQGIEEPFDTVVTTARSLVPGRAGATRAAAVHSWAFPWPASVPAPDHATEAWGETAAAFTVPVTDGAHVRLVAAGETDPVAAVSVADLADRFGGLFEGVADPFADLDAHALRYRQTPRVVPESLCVGGTVLVGPAAHAAIPGDCLGPTLGIEDAWVLADALAYGPAARDDALADYERRRRRRLDAVDDAAGPAGTTDRLPTGCAPLLDRLCAARSLAFGHLFDTHDADLVRDVPGCL